AWQPAVGDSVRTTRSAWRYANAKDGTFWTRKPCGRRAARHVYFGRFGESGLQPPHTGVSVEPRPPPWRARHNPVANGLHPGPQGGSNKATAVGPVASQCELLHERLERQIGTRNEH